MNKTLTEVIEPKVKIIEGIKTFRGRAFEYINKTTPLKDEVQERRYLERITTTNPGKFGDENPELGAIGNGSIYPLRGILINLRNETSRLTRIQYWNDMGAEVSVRQRVQTDFDSGYQPFLIGVDAFLKAEGKYLAEAHFEKVGLFRRPVLWGMFFRAK